MTEDDTTRRYHRGNPESVAAWDRAKHKAPKDRERIREYYWELGRQGRGATSDKMQFDLMGGDHSNGSARCTDMRKDGTLVGKRIFPIDESEPYEKEKTRKGVPAAVLYLAEFLPPHLRYRFPPRDKKSTAKSSVITPKKKNSSDAAGRFFRK